MVNKKNVSAIIVTYNGMKWYDQCFGSLMQSEIPVHIVVIDNASTDGSAEYIAKNFPEIHLIKSVVNLGFAKANNIGIRYAIDNGADYVFLLNQDAWLNGACTLTKLIRTFDKNTRTGIVSPIHLNGQASEMDWQYSTCIPGDMISDLYMGAVKCCYNVPFINAAAWLISADCINKVGGFDTSMFIHYGEDNNYCHRVLYHKYKILINTECTICHDREERRKQEEEYRAKNFAQNNLAEKIMWSNLLLDINIDEHINGVKRSIKKAAWKLKFKKVRDLKNILSFYNKVKFSRETNKRGGLVWL